jgi:sugar phosphate permease
MKVVPIARDVAYALRNGLANASATWRPAVLVFLPFAAGYYLSYLFRTVNALISDRLVADLGLAAADLGFLTSAYFLTFAAMQLPLGVRSTDTGRAAFRVFCC